MTTHLQSASSPSAPGSRLWEREGLFYAELADPASGDPLCVVLHGVTSLQQATEAMSLLAIPVTSPRAGSQAVRPS